MTSVYSSYSVIATKYSKVSRMLLEKECIIQHFLQSATCLGVKRNSVLLCFFALGLRVGLCNSQTFLINGIIVLAVLRFCNTSCS